MTALMMRNKDQYLAGLRDVMTLLEQIPQGAVGAAGATLDEINAASDAGRAIANDPTYHCVQWAWRRLEALSKELP